MSIFQICNFVLHNGNQKVSTFQNVFWPIFKTAHLSTSCFNQAKPNIPVNELKITYSSSSGPGGQNVNKLATKVDVRLHLDTSEWLSDQEKIILKEKLSNMITKDGWILVKSEKTRSQSANESDAIERLSNIINEALKPPEPKFTEEELRRMRKGKIKADKERLKNKMIRSDTKRDRRGPEF